MQTLTIYGASDDLVEAYGIDGCDEFGSLVCVECKNYVGRMLVKASDEAICIHVVYAGSWAFAITTEMGDFEEMPDWPVRRIFGKNCPYSETLEIDVPDGTVLKWLD